MQNCFDKSLICDTLHLVDNCVRSAGASSRFSFLRAPDPAVPSPNQPKTRPLESINSELQFLYFLSFDIHMNCGGRGVYTLIALHRQLDRMDEQTTPPPPKARTPQLQRPSVRTST